MSDQPANQEQQGANGHDGPAHLFSDFPAPTYEQWREVTEKSLKGASFEKKLLTKTYEGITLQPIYRQEDAASLTHPQTMPGLPPYVRGTSASGYLTQPWGIAQELTYSTPAELNEALRNDMARGQTVASLAVDQATRTGFDPDQAPAGTVGQGGVSLASVADLAQALDGIDLASTSVFVQAGTNGLAVATLLAGLLRQQGKPTSSLQGWVRTNPLGELARTGSLPLSLEQAYAEMAELTTWASKEAPGLKTIEVGFPGVDGGGNAVHDLAFTLAVGIAYLRQLGERGVAVDTAAGHLKATFAVGTNLFMEIGKLRAARLLWSQIVAAFGGSDAARKLHIHVDTTRWNKTVADPFVNMLRTTIEAFGGAIGGCDSMHVSPFDDVLRQPDQFSRRIARNTQLILQQECNLTRLVDPVGGSWYVETLADTLARDAWKLLQEVERQGGILAALQAGFPQAEIARVAGERAKALATRRDTLVGTNMYPNLKEKPLDRRPLDPAALQATRASQVQRSADAAAKLAPLAGAAPGSRLEPAIEAARAGATVGELTRALRPAGGEAPGITPVRVHRGAEPFEAMRQAAEAHMARTGKRPQVFLATMGPIVQHKARADFTTGFLEVSGFEMVRPDGFATPDDAARAVLEAGAPIVVICSTDETYPDLVPPLVQQIKAANPTTVVLLAGYPTDHVEAFKTAGIDDFIHLRANCYEMNAQLQQKIGVSA